MIAAGSLIPGIGMMTMGVSIPLGSFNLPGLLLASILAVVFNLVLPKEDEAAMLRARPQAKLCARSQAKLRTGLRARQRADRA